MDAWDAAQSPPSAPQSPAPRPPAPPPPIPKADASGGDNKDFRRCPSASCNYLNLAKAKFCVACGMELTAAKGRPTVQQPDAPQQQPPPPRRPRGNEETQRDEIMEPQEEIAPARPAPPPEPAVAPKQRPVAPSNVNATVNPWSKRKQASFTLHPLSREGEPLKEALMFEGTTELNRTNIDPANTTITSKIQAVIEHRDGQWYISNESALQTTFIRVDEPTPLKKGDVILMGDRLFQFSEED